MPHPSDPDLTSTSRVAWVTGASRGIGRGVAVALGAAGWTVWVTGRSSTSGSRTSHLPGTIEATAADVDAGGGQGIARVCDHSVDRQVAAVAAEIAEGGRLDLLVNNAWGGYERLNAGAFAEWNAPFWEQPIDLFDAMFTSGVRAHYVASRLATPVIMRRPGGLIVTISMDVGQAHSPDHGVAYSASKAADDRLIEAMAGQVRGSGTAAVSLYPGLVRTEGVMQFAEHLDLSRSQSCEGVGRVIVALAHDRNLLALSGRALSVSDLAVGYAVDLTS